MQPLRAFLTLSLLELALANRLLLPARPPKSDSLARLLRSVADDYFDDCTLDVIYDSTYERYDPVDFRSYLGDMRLSLTQESVDLAKGEKPRERRSDKCANYLVFLQNIMAIKDIIGQNVKSKILVVSAETPWEVKHFLKSHVSRAYKHLLVVARSTSRKNGDGSYLLYTHKLYAEGSGATQPLLIASWINDGLTVEGANLFPEKLRNGFMGHRLIVSTFENAPFTVKRSLDGSLDSKWDGLEVRFLRLAAEYLNFTTEFTETRSAELSPIDSIKRDVALGVASTAIGGIYQTAELADSFDAASAFLEDCASFISLASTALPKYRAILGPFQLTVWLMVCASYFILIIPLSFNSNYTLLSLIKHPSGVNKIFWFIFSTYTNSFEVKSPLLDHGLAKNSISILLGIYWIFTIIVTASYTGSIVAFITLPVYPAAIESAAELQAYRYRIGTLDHNGWNDWFSSNATEDDPFLLKLFRRIEYVPTLLEGVRNASRAYFWPYAFLASRTALDYIIQTDFAPSWTTKRSLMHISDECFVRYNVVQLFAADSLYTRPVNEFAARAAETGFVKKIQSDVDWELQRIAIKTNKQITKKMSMKTLVEDRTLTVEDTQGMFLILGTGVLAALLALSLESIAHFVKYRHLPKDGRRRAPDWAGRAQAQKDSWLLRRNRFPGVRHEPDRASV